MGARNNDGNTPLHEASMEGHMDVVRALWQGQMWELEMMVAVLHCMRPPVEGSLRW